MKISFVWDWPNYTPQTITWKDGLARAIQILSQKYELQFLTCGDKDFVLPHEYFDIHVSTDIQRDVKAFNPDVILMWGDCTRPNASKCAELGKPMALCYAGGDVNGPTNGCFDHFFVESQVYKDKFDSMGKSCSIAFGTNTELFKLMPKQQKVFDVCFPATYARWKRHDIFSKATKDFRAITAGYIIPAEEYCADWCRDTGSLVLPHVSPEALRFIYAASKCCLVTSHWTGGSQRTVLEAMSMNIPLIVMEDSDKCVEYVSKAGEGIICGKPLETSAGYDCKNVEEAIKAAMIMQVNTREWVMQNYSEFMYADNLEKGLCSLLQ